VYNFSEKEFECRCGKCGLGFKDMDPKTIQRIEAARIIAGIPFFITSGIRCKEYNQKIGGSKTSSHLIGRAVDISSKTDIERYTIVYAAKKAGFTRIGIGKDFIHVDDDIKKDKKVCWIYQ